MQLVDKSYPTGIADILDRLIASVLPMANKDVRDPGEKKAPEGAFVFNI